MIEKFKNILKKEKISPKEFCKEIGITYPSYQTMISRKGIIPKWIKGFILGYTLKTIRNIEVKDEEVL